MSTTTLKIPNALKVRFADAAQLAGKSAHALVEALEAATRRAEMRQDFVNSALQAEQEVVRHGEVQAMDAVHRYFNDKLAGKSPKRPKSTVEVLKPPLASNDKSVLFARCSGGYRAAGRISAGERSACRRRDRS